MAAPWRRSCSRIGGSPEQLTAVRDARSSSASDDTYKTGYAYNTFGDRTSTTTPATADFPSGRTESFAFTDGTETAVGGGTVPAGLLATSTDLRGGVTTREYTAAGDLAKVTTPAGVTTTYGYDALGRETSAKRISDAFPTGVTWNTAYDGESRVTAESEPPVENEITGVTHQARTEYTYDPSAGRTGAAVFTRGDRVGAGWLGVYSPIRG